MATATAPTPSAPSTEGPPSYPGLVRLTHFLNLAVVFTLIGSGLEIFNAHPSLYAADTSDPDHIVMSLPATPDGEPDTSTKLEMVVLGQHFGVPAFLPQTFPAPFAWGGWLEGGRRMHFTAAYLFILNGLLYFFMTVFGRRKRKVWPGVQDLKEVGPSLKNHLKLPPVLHGKHGALNPMQKMAYFSIPIILGPLVVATGLALSPQWDAIFPFWTGLFGGRQFARTWHFVAMAGLVGFILSHVLLVAISGRWTWLRMVTGKVVLPAEEHAV